MNKAACPFVAAAVVLGGCAAPATSVRSARGVTEEMPAGSAAPEASVPSLPMPPPPPAKPGPVPVSEPASNTLRTIGWVSLGIGAQAAIVAGATSIIIVNDLDNRSAGCNAQKVCSVGGFGANAQIQSLSGWNLGAWILAAVGVGVGTYLVLAHPPGHTAKADGKLTTTLATIPGGAALVVEGSF